MENKTSMIEGIHRLASTGSSTLLEHIRPPSQTNQILTENQALVDRFVSSFLDEATKLSTMAALLGANFVSRFSRIGVLAAGSSLLGEGKTLLPIVVRGSSYGIALSNESAAFAGIERGFARLEGHSSSSSFGEDWVHAGITLGSLKFFGALTQGQNMIVQHLAADLGLVGARHLGYAFRNMDKPQGTLAQQMFQAEATNWQLKGSMALAHGLSPHLLPMERALDLSLKSLEVGFSQKIIEANRLSLLMASGMTCLGCNGGHSSHGDLIFWSSIAVTNLAAYLIGFRSGRAKSKRNIRIDQFHSLETKSLEDLIEVIKATTSYSEKDIKNALHTVLHYGAPPRDARIDNPRVLKSIAVDILRLPPVERHGGIPIRIHHKVLDPRDRNNMIFSSITGMPLAYADRIRDWVMKNLLIDLKRMAPPDERGKRLEILSQKIHQKFQLPIERAEKIVQLILRTPGKNPTEQRAKLFENEFPVLKMLDDEDWKDYEFHLRLSRQAAHWILSEAGYPTDTARMIWLKDIIAQLCAECGLPVPGYSMAPFKFIDYPEDEHRKEFMDHDWQAVYRLRDAVWGPWRLPWEE